MSLEQREGLSTWGWGSICEAGSCQSVTELLLSLASCFGVSGDTFHHNDSGSGGSKEAMCYFSIAKHKL